ncbi:GreA/GreB family elongation factor [Piscinibacter koreensis]|uniref:GreA/GreB family elongation factor n=1 Tax=Piscinibacter koreensis TaxID=2742824 RepID=A0A7Y6TUV3_9BURK|nr:GreA/GreB family elongation factor [Schlegelella koreensis]NUZ04247.1 GreA/GreB family elongation factor [Schlegelella koreensis]
MEVPNTERTLTLLDHTRITNFIRRSGVDAAASQFEAILAVLDDAATVQSHQVAPDVVTMHSRVVVRIGGAERELTLCYPGHADADAGHVSVLSPIGAALLGQRVGAVARWRSPTGSEASAEVVAIAFQPEAMGHYAM